MQTAIFILLKKSNQAMIWFYFIITIILLLCPNTTILVNSSSFANQLVAVAVAVAVATPEPARGGGVVNKCFHKEIHALLHFKASLEDPLDHLSTWRPQDDDCCKWRGVTCNNQTFHVTELDLSGNSVRGEISPSLVNLSYLNHLDLSKKFFEGEISPSLVNLSYLNHLDLSNNDFNGTLPKSVGSLTQLRYLDLSYNLFHGTIPSEFGNLTKLQSLTLGDSGPSRVENLDWLFSLSHLQSLEMNMVSLAKANHWVDVILSLQKLSSLSLRACDLSEVKHPYSSFVNSSLSSITYLSLGHNNLNSSMYRWLFPLITSNRLVILELSFNMLDGIPKYLKNLSSLESLSLINNSAVVHFPDFLNNLCGLRLRQLVASNGRFTGSVPDEIQNFSSLEYLDLSHNHLNGTMSEKVWEIPHLRNLDVSSNSLIILPSTGKSKLWLDVVDLSGCQLGPLFPKWIQTYKEIVHLDIANTRISNTIPVDFWNTWPSTLVHLNLSFNNISGEVPDLSSNFQAFSLIDFNNFNGPRIDLSSNNFYGPIQNVHPSVAWLNLSKNKFYGGISFLCQIVDGFLLFLDLSHNSLTGQLPDCLWHFKKLKVLNLGHNNLSGRLPASIGYLVQLEVLHLYNNNFSGKFPLALKNCTRLGFLNLGANKFIGNVPVWINGENLGGLYAFSLRSNNFFGLIPFQLCSLMYLQILDLSMNNLNGTIPSCVNNFNAMVEVGVMSAIDIHYPNSDEDDGLVVSFPPGYVDNAMIEWQGNEHEFTNNLGLLRSIDLSSNNLTGKIPNELTDLHILLALNLSKNALLGEIPRKIGEMKQLLTLDLSRNTLSGRIPSSMSQMTFLSYLDVSHNSLSGRIPYSTQLQSFEPSKYTGNAGLCGPPLTKSCPGDDVLQQPVSSKTESGEEGTDELDRLFYIGGGIGFAIGFWVACGALIVNRRGRHAFFPLVDFLQDQIYVKVVVFIRKVSRVQHI